jgi:hypothetical protein
MSSRRAGRYDAPMKPRHTTYATSDDAQFTQAHRADRGRQDELEAPVTRRADRRGAGHLRRTGEGADTLPWAC